MGDQKALNIYNALCHHTLDVCLAVPFDRHLWYYPDINYEDEWSNKAFQKFQQQGENLGEKLIHALTHAFRTNNKAFVIGTDCPLLSKEHLLKAADALNYVDVVIGPAFDGGYYLIGMKELHSDLFKSITWSSEEVLRQTLQKIGQNRLSCMLLEALPDIDYEEDWERYGWEIEN